MRQVVYLQSSPSKIFSVASGVRASIKWAGPETSDGSWYVFVGGENSLCLLKREGNFFEEIYAKNLLDERL